MALSSEGELVVRQVTTEELRSANAGTPLFTDAVEIEGGLGVRGDANVGGELIAASITAAAVQVAGNIAAANATLSGH
eukprot:2537539-Pleurochrysis_carterae.AAC.1